MSDLKPYQTVLLIDDHEIVRKAIAEYVSNYPNFKVIGDVNGYEELEVFLKENAPPNILLLDIVMPGKNGFEVAEWMRANYPAVKMLALSSESDNHVIAKIIRKGARGYVNKSAGPAAFLTALETVVKGDIYLSQKDFNAMSTALQDENYFALENAVLTDNEKKYLKLLCTAMSHKLIAETMNISIRTIEDYKDSIATKIGVSTRQEMVVYAVKNNYN